jgi:heme/copper-type cytochrome/quinol oxidase subunit 4
MVYRASRSVFFVLSFAICAICTTIPPKALLALHLGTLAKRNDDCGFEGNSDLYGLGIRLGVYFQWASAQIIYGWYPEGRNELAESYLVFLFAITIAIIVITAQAEPTYAAEILILTYIIFGGIFTVVSIGIRQRHRSRVEGGEHQVQTLIFTIILASASVYCSWFWLHGLHHNVLQTPCGTFGFLFAKVSLYNKSVYKFFAFLSVYFAFAYTVGLLAIAGVFVFYYLGFTGAGKYMGILLSRRETGPETATHSNTTPPSARQPPKQTHSVVSRLNPSLDDKM